MPWLRIRRKKRVIISATPVTYNLWQKVALQVWRRSVLDKKVWQKTTVRTYLDERYYKVETVKVKSSANIGTIWGRVKRDYLHRLWQSLLSIRAWEQLQTQTQQPRQSLQRSKKGHPNIKNQGGVSKGLCQRLTRIYINAVAPRPKVNTKNKK